MNHTLHCHLRKSFSWYHQWHKHPRHSHAHWLFFVSVALLTTAFFSSEILSLHINDNNAQAQSGNIRYYGHYFVEDDGKNLRLVDEVSSFTNIINFRYDSGAGNQPNQDNVDRILDAGVKVMLQVPFNEGQFTNPSIRDAYLNGIKTYLNSLNFMSAVVYFAVSEEWYTILQADNYTQFGDFDWAIFAGKSKNERLAIAKTYLEAIIDDVHRIFPGIPTVIVENILPYPAPPNNVDVLGIDAYYIPTNSSCDSTQRAKFDSEVIPYFEAAKPYGKPIMMVPPSFDHSIWRMLSECQMQWYSDLARSGNYNIESFIWFVYGSFSEGSSPVTGVRDFPNLVAYQKIIACQLLGGSYCSGVPPPPPPPPPPGPPPPNPPPPPPPPPPGPCNQVLCGNYSLNPQGSGPGVILEYHVNP